MDDTRKMVLGGFAPEPNRTWFKTETTMSNKLAQQISGHTSFQLGCDARTIRDVRARPAERDAAPHL